MDVSNMTTLNFAIERKFTCSNRTARTHLGGKSMIYIICENCDERFPNYISDYPFWKWILIESRCGLSIDFYLLALQPEPLPLRLPGLLVLW